MAKGNGGIDFAIRETLQELILAALSKTDFFKKAAFYGGTALRIFYGLPRFSENLDFSLVKKDDSFHWDPYFDEIESVFNRYGLKIDALEKEKITKSDVRSAFVKQNTIETMKVILPSDIVAPRINHNQVTRIKFEADTLPPDGARYQWLNLTDPFYADIRVLDLPSLFAGKISAVLLRHWKNRVKGRDFFDYLFHVGRGSKINMEYLYQNLLKAGVKPEKWNMDVLKALLKERFESVDFVEAANETREFLDNPDDISKWDLSYFLSTLDRLNEN
ncbi:MAG: nucleotidyl transferase AbiEii/AbiGii toxin family protein [Bacilli bacterium]|nr:nucleotidyl transferase AbiEii/AbiGii toxin family protein [Bacilli bacterium]